MAAIADTADLEHPSPVESSPGQRWGGEWLGLDATFPLPGCVTLDEGLHLPRALVSSSVMRRSDSTELAGPLGQVIRSQGPKADSARAKGLSSDLGAYLLSGPRRRRPPGSSWC